MSHAPGTKKPEDAYVRLEVDESAGLPIYGARNAGSDGTIRRDVLYAEPYTPLWGRDYYVKNADQKIDAMDRIMGVMSRETPADTIGGPYRRFLDWAHNLALGESELDPNASPQNLMFVISGPGIGKTHMPKVMSKAFGYDHELIGSGEAGGDIDELVIAHEFKGESAGDIAQKIEAKLSEDAESLSKRQLVDLLRKAGFLIENENASEETYRYRLDLDAIMKAPPADPERQGEAARERTGDEEAEMESNIKRLYEIAENAGIELKQEAGIGVQKVNGRLLKKLLQVKEQYERSGRAEPVIITLDEFNRFRSFGKKLQNFWEVVGGASSEPVTLVDAAGQSHTFTPDMLKFVFVYMTGNDPKKVPGARDLDYSMLDRIGENRTFRLEDFSISDWQHRLEQQLLGIGIDIHWRAGGGNDGYWNNHKSEFTDHLHQKRQQGLTDSEARLFTPMQDELLTHWDRVHQGVGQVATFIKYWADIYSKSEHRAEYNRMETKPSITPRLLNHMMNELRSAKVKGGSLEANMELMASGARPVPERVGALNLGTKMTDFIRKSIDKAHPNPNSGIRQDLYRKMYELGIVSKTEAKRGLGGADLSEMFSTKHVELVEDLLNIDPNRTYDKELRPLQIAIADAVRQRYPEQADKADNEIITIDQVEKTIAAVRVKEVELAKQDRPSDMPAVFQQLILPQLDIGEAGVSLDLKQTVIADALIREEQISEDDRKRIINGIKNNSELPNTLATTTEVLLGFALPSGTHEQLAHLFNPDADRVVEANAADSMMLVRQRSFSRATPAEQKAEQAVLDEAEKDAADRTGQLDPAHEGEVQHTEWLEEAEKMLTHKHESGLSAVALHTVGFDKDAEEGQRHFSDTLQVISFSYENPEDPEQVGDRTLIVGHTPISEELKVYLEEKRNITYVCAKDKEANNQITDALYEIMGMAQAKLAQSVDDGDHPDLEETASSGLLLHLQQALAIRTPEAAKPEPTPSDNDWDVVTGGGSTTSDDDKKDESVNLYTDRFDSIVEQLLDEKNRVSEHNLPEHVTTRSWQELIASRKPNETELAVG